MNKKVVLLSCLSILCYAEYDPQFSRVDEKPHVINIFKEMPILVTQRLLLRPLCMRDAQDLFEIHGNNEVVQYMSISEDSLEQTEYWIAWRKQRQADGNPVPWAIVDKETNKVIGVCGFYRIDYPRAAGEVMITLHRQYWGKGYMLEAMKAVATCGFDTIGLNRIDALVYPENKRIIALCEKVGLRRIGHIPECLYYKGRHWDRIYYTLLKKDWEQIKNKLLSYC